MRRLQNVFSEDGKSVIIAMDHGIMMNVLPELGQAESVLEGIIAGGADAVLTSYGLARKYEKILSSLGLIVRLDGGNTEMTEITGGERLYSIEDALKLGADGVACMGFPGETNELRTLSNVSHLAAKCDEWNIPLLAEMLPGGFSDEVPNSNYNVKLAARMGSELGAHIVKTAYPDDVDGMGDVAQGSLSPVVILGGSKSDEQKGVLDEIEKAISRGVKGVAIGRNVWKSNSPQRMTQAIVDIVHEGRSSDDV